MTFEEPSILEERARVIYNEPEMIEATLEEKRKKSQSCVGDSLDLKRMKLRGFKSGRFRSPSTWGGNANGA